VIVVDSKLVRDMTLAYFKLLPGIRLDKLRKIQIASNLAEYLLQTRNHCYGHTSLLCKMQRTYEFVAEAASLDTLTATCVQLFVFWMFLALSA